MSMFDAGAELTLSPHTIAAEYALLRHIISPPVCM